MKKEESIADVIKRMNKAVKTQPNPIVDAVINKVSTTEIASWKRMMKRMDKLIEKIRPIEEEIVKLVSKKIPIFDKIQELRMEMVVVCIHPKEHLVIQGQYVLCKFCEKKLQVPHAKE